MTDQTAMVPASDSRLDFGQTNLRPQDFVTPRVKVVQQMAKEAADKLADPGDFYNTLFGQSYGPSMKVQPILTFMNRILLVRNDKSARSKSNIDSVLIENGLPELPEGDGLMCRSFDMIEGRGSPGIACEKCPLALWDEDTRQPPLCTETYNVAAMDDVGGLVVLSFSRSSAKVGKRLFSALRMRPGAPWLSVYEFATRQERNDQGTFYVPDFKVAAEGPSQDQIQGALAWAHQLRGVVIDVTPDEEEGADATAPSGDKPF